jgi:probable phosphoglycerate mutase
LAAVVASGFDVVFLARHGQTEWNTLRRRQGQLDSPLTVVGQMQADQLAATVNNLDVDGLFCSPLGRAMSTATRCALVLGIEAVVLDELAEVHHGTMAGLTNDQIEQRFPGQLARRSAEKYQWRFPGGESYADANDRAAVALDRIAQQGVRRPLVVSHEMIGRMLLQNLVGASPTESLQWNQPHDVVVRVVNGGFETVNTLRQ